MMNFFEEKVLDGLKSALADTGSTVENCHVIGAAVSGGADSVSLLMALKNILPPACILKVITVNHNIRPEEETSGDAHYVENLCKSLGVKCVRHEIKRGLVELNSKKEKQGIECSARSLRYDAFEKFIESEKLDFLCLAHNKNDQLETVLMRIISGSIDLSGIPRSRGKILRPLLSVTRQEIESYLREIKVSYRTDSTNLENGMLRNRIRNVLVPVLDENFSCWKKGIEILVEKSICDGKILENLSAEAMEKIGYEKKSGTVTFDAESFFSLHEALKERILMKAAKDAGPTERISRAFIKRWTDRNHALSKKQENSSGIQFWISEGIFYAGKKIKVATESGFFVIIEKTGTFVADGNFYHVEKINGQVVISSGAEKIMLNEIDFPFAFRSRQSGDEIKGGNGKFRSVSKILDGWKALELKDKIPVIQQIGGPTQDIKCIWGSLFGLSDWIVMA